MLRAVDTVGLALLVSTVIGGCARLSINVDTLDSGDGDEVVTLEQCPAPVRATIEKHRHGGEIREIERTTDHGEVLYEVDVTAADGIIEFDIAADGTFRGYEADDDDDDDDDEEGEKEIPLADVPEHVKKAALAAVPGIVLEEAEVETEDGVLIYELEGEADGKEYEIEVDAAGKVLEIEIDDEDDDDGDDDD